MDPSDQVSGIIWKKKIHRGIKFLLYGTLSTQQNSTQK